MTSPGRGRWTIVASGRPTDELLGAVNLPGFPDSVASKMVAAAAAAAMALRPQVDHGDGSACAVVLVTEEWDAALASRVEVRLNDGVRLSPMHLMQLVPNGVLGRIAQKHRLTGPILALYRPRPFDVVSHLDRLVPPESARHALCVSLGQHGNELAADVEWCWIQQDGVAR
jgi:hypothetical protein